MIVKRKPRIGLLTIMLGAYEPLFPGIMNKQGCFVEDVIKSVSHIADIDFNGVAYDRESIEHNVKTYNENCDGILIIFLTYSHSGWLIRAMQENKIPIALALLQPDENVEPDFKEYDFTRNQGIHGSQDNANILTRLGVPFKSYVGRKDDKFVKFFTDFAKASYIYNSIKSLKIAVIGKMTGMGDLFADDIRMQAILGAEFCYCSIGSIYKLMTEVKDEEINREIKFEKTIFNIDKDMPYSAHAYAVRQYLAIKRFLELGEFNAFTLHFETLGEDGRFESLPFLAASNLLADGYGYAAEGDAICACAVLIGQLLSEAVTFSEMYALDYKTDSILFCHAGEGNWRVAHEDSKPKLVYKVFNEGGLGNPPTPLFAAQHGEATVVSFAPSDKGLKIIVATGEITGRNDLVGCEMPYIFFKPKMNKEKLIE